MNRDDQSGMTLVEVVLAAALIMTVVAGTLNGIASMTKATGSNEMRDGAAAVAYRSMEAAKAFGCGLATGSGTGSETNASLTALRNRCWSSLSDATFTDAGYTVGFVTRWSVTGQSFTTCNQLATQTPDTLLRRVTVNYDVQGRSVTQVVSSREALPPDAVGYNLAGRGGAIISGVAATARVTMRSSATTGWADVTRGPDANGCVWFPFLAPGTYAFTNSSGATYPTQNIVAGSQVVV